MSAIALRRRVPLATGFPATGLTKTVRSRFTGRAEAAVAASSPEPTMKATAGKRAIWDKASSSQARIALRGECYALFHVHRLDVHELPDAQVGQLAAVTRLLDAPEGQARVGADDGVDEAVPRLQRMGGDPLAAREVPGEDGRAESERAVVGQLHRLVLVARGNDRGHRPEHLLVERHHAPAHVGEDRRRIERALPFRWLAAQEDAGAGPHRVFDLPLHGVAQVVTGERAELDAGLERVAHLLRPHLLHEQLLEALPHGRNHDEALGRDAALTAVDEARGHARLGGGVEV